MDLPHHLRPFLSLYLVPRLISRQMSFYLMHDVLCALCSDLLALSLFPFGVYFNDGQRDGQRSTSATL